MPSLRDLDKLKLALIKPTYKVKNYKSELNNFKTVLIFPSISKIPKKGIYEYARLDKFLERHGILDGQNYGFRNIRSTTNAVIYLLGHLLQINKVLRKISIGLFVY